MSDEMATWLGEQFDEDENEARRLYPSAAAVRLLRETEAKRRIIAEHALNGWVCSTCDDGEVPPQAYPCPTLRLLALPYADRPGYREEWRP